LITGGRRVGRALALDLAARGARIALTYRTSRDVIEMTAAQIRDQGGTALTLNADLSLGDQAERVVAEVVSAFGRIDVLVGMASEFRRTPLATLTPADFDAMIAANLATIFHPSVSAVRQMLKQPAVEGVRGKVIHVGDWSTERPYRDYLPYLVAKGALQTLTMGLAREGAPEVMVNLVEPALIDLPPDMTSPELAAVITATPLRRIGSPSDINRLILYLLEGTDFATGATFRVDGGRFLGNED
jgi:pteridine reductase